MASAAPISGSDHAPKDAGKFVTLNVIGQDGIGLVERFTQIEHQPSHGIGGISAIAQELLLRLIALDDLILFESKKQIEKGSRGDRKSADGVLQGDHDRVNRAASVASEQLAAPPAQEL